MSPKDQYSIRIPSIHQVEYSEKGLRVRFSANIRDHEIFLGNEEISGRDLTAAELDTVIGRVYTYLNTDRAMQIDFVRPDRSFWGEPQHWRATSPSDHDARAIRVWPWERNWNGQSLVGRIVHWLAGWRS